MKELWKPVIGHDGKYEVSNLGRVRGPGSGVKPPILPRFIMKPQRVKRRPASSQSTSYFFVGLHRNGKLRFRAVHVMVAEAFICPRPLGKVVNHMDGEGTHNIRSNLEWVTPSENSRHAVRMGHHATMRGSRNGMSKLTAVQVRQIRKLLGPPRARWVRGVVSKSSLARHFGVTPSAIYYIHKRLVWKHLNSPQAVMLSPGPQ